MLNDIKNNEDTIPTNRPLTLINLKNEIPKQCFEKSLPRSLYYMIRDILLISTSFFTYDLFSTTWLGLFIYWNIYGFLMWCLFVVGHDCGHGSFSKYPIVNAICGHICHTPLLVPFFPWAYSHRKHHQFHNHKMKDTSHPWFTEEEIKADFVKKYYTTSFLSPFLSYGFYLYPGMYDGSHVIPTGKLFNGSDKYEKIKCLISAATIGCFMAALYMIFSSWSQFALCYGGCWLVFCFWLFMVTYMQHHDEETVLYDDSSWDFITAALQTIDRKFGSYIDKTHHNITDGHLVHHLFFTHIPHYNLRKATEAIVPRLGKEYKIKKHKVFILDFWKLFFKLGYSKWILKSNKTR